MYVPCTRGLIRPVKLANIITEISELIQEVAPCNLLHLEFHLERHFWCLYSWDWQFYLQYHFDCLKLWWQGWIPYNHYYLLGCWWKPFATNHALYQKMDIFRFIIRRKFHLFPMTLKHGWGGTWNHVPLLMKEIIHQI